VARNRTSGSNSAFLFGLRFGVGMNIHDITLRRIAFERFATYPSLYPSDRRDGVGTAASKEQLVRERFVPPPFRAAERQVKKAVGG
jgi:hypothetical protein